MSSPLSPSPAGSNGRPLIRFNKPSNRGPGYEFGEASSRFQGDGTPRSFGTPTPHNLSRTHTPLGKKEDAAGDRKGSGRRIAKHILHDLLACVGEFVGTFMFLTMAFIGAQSAGYNKGTSAAGPQSVTTTDNQTILFIALSFGMSLLVTAWVFFRISGSAFNPAVTFALWLVGNLTARRATLVVLAQMLGGMAAAGVAKGLTLGEFGVGNSLVPGLGKGKGLCIELFTTALLVFTVLMLAAEKSKSTFLAPVAIGLALFVGHLASVGWTGAGINPARSFGPSVANANFPSYAWIYYLGQLLGAVVATIIYVILKHLDYEEVVAGIDSTNPNLSQAVHDGPMMKAYNKFEAAIPRRSSVSEETAAPENEFRTSDLESGLQEPRLKAVA